MSRILVVDDETAIREAVVYALRNEGFEVEEAEDGETGLELALSGSHAVVLLDLMLPGIPGTEVCRQIRSASPVPVIMLTARGAEVERVLGLEIGADDYITKPFSMAELIGRIRAIIRRRELDRGAGGGTVTVGSLELDPMRHEARIDGKAKRLTPSEFKLLLLLARSPERVFSRREIMQHLWESEYVGDQRACDIHISNLRRKLERDAARPERIVTVRGVGYKLEAV